MRTTSRALVALALAAVLGAGCASTPAGTGTAGPAAVDERTTDRDQAVEFAGCMRDNGVAAFPDPDASGALTIDAVANGSSVDPSSAAFEQALAACRDLQPAGFTGHQRDAEDQESALAFARCIREHGVADFPDPEPDGPLVDTNRIPSLAESDDLSILDAAMKTCGDLVAAQLGSP